MPYRRWKSRPQGGRPQIDAELSVFGDASEADLQADLRDFLKGNLVGAEVLSEVHGVATGRTDLYISFGGPTFVIELKKHDGEFSQEAAERYRPQATKLPSRQCPARISRRARTRRSSRSSAQHRGMFVAQRLYPGRGRAGPPSHRVQGSGTSEITFCAALGSGPHR